MTILFYYTSDLHIGHSNIIKLCKRPFSDVAEMNEALITNWNNKVTNADRVYIAGDLMFRYINEPNMILKRLKGKKYLILGNHDKQWIKKADLSMYFESVDRLAIVNTGKHVITICHYPTMSFEGKYLIHGHIHNNRNASYWSLLKNMDNVLNCCVEINNYMPVSFDELIKNNLNFKTSPIEDI